MQFFIEYGSIIALCFTFLSDIVLAWRTRKSKDVKDLQSQVKNLADSFQAFIDILSNKEK